MFTFYGVRKMKIVQQKKKATIIDETAAKKKHVRCFKYEDNWSRIKKIGRSINECDKNIIVLAKIAA